MVEEQGKVVALDHNEAWVQTSNASACQHCTANKACGQSVLLDLSQGKANQVRVFNSLHVKVGDQVVIGIPEDIIVMSSLMVYILPLVLAAIVGAISDWLWATEWLTIMSVLLGLAGGFGIVQSFGRRHQRNPNYQPQLLRRVPEFSDNIVSHLM